MKVFITGAQAISPQDTFLNKDVPENILKYTEPLSNIAVNFKDYFPPLQSRRINRLIKTGHICALETVKQAGIEKPDAIITGSGLGCVESTEKFLNDMLTTDEGLLAPTSFIQSTSNAIGAQIALHFNCQGYNVLYAQKAYSFENALHDAFLRVIDGEEKNILVGGFDEITLENWKLKQNIGLYKKDPFTNTEILNTKTEGSIPGEGSAFFLLTTEPVNNALAELVNLHQYSSELAGNDVGKWIIESLAKNSIPIDNIDLVLLGFNGDESTDRFYREMMDTTFNNATLAYYKHLCGEYDTAIAFGTWIGVNALMNNKLPKHSLITNRNRDFKTILIYNQHQSKNHSLIILKTANT
jgi:3-oxoacyl-[acyl-carrier-protein] synthase II